MNKNKRGFTLIEVTLFLAVTVALFVGIAAGVQNSIFQQRYNDSVQNFAEFMRSIYSQVSNVQNENTGRSDTAIYGKVVVFDVDENAEDGPRNVITTYNLVGDLQRVQASGKILSNVELKISDDKMKELCTSQDNSVISKLSCLNASVFVEKKNSLGLGLGHFPVGFIESYAPRWDARIQTKAGWGSGNGGGYNLFKGIMIVTHSPNSGNIYTYILQDNPDAHYSNADKDTAIKFITERLKDCAAGGCDYASPFWVGRPTDGTFENYLDSDHFTQDDIDFCINPNGLDKSTVRKNIRIAAGVHNASGVQIMDDYRDENNIQGGEYNRCDY